MITKTKGVYEWKVVKGGGGLCEVNPSVFVLLAKFYFTLMIISSLEFPSGFKVVKRNMS